MRGKNTEYSKECPYCYTPIESCIHARRCFMTGEYCSKQSNIQREREKLYKGDKIKIKAFVIMNFSDMSNVVYKWRLRTFIESLTEYLYIDREHNRLYCSSVEDDSSLYGEKIDSIEVVRSDTDPASNYVVCNRICQQMQIADLVIVDVSSQNANVFYEFGMAVALGKLILPICYSERFYKMVFPRKLKYKYWDLTDKEKKDIGHHIGFFPWRKALFEYYGIRYKNVDSQTEYIAFKDVINPEYGFDDLKYDRFPYHEVIPEDQKYDQSQHYEEVSKNFDKKAKSSIGEKIYNRLRNEYNNAEAKDNTLIVYTMDAFLNKEQAGSCIVNFYRNITARMNQEKCFRGERVGVLVQENVIPENEKDAMNQMDIFYNIGEIIQIGTNQATYLAAEEKIKADDDFTILERSTGEKITDQGRQQRKDIERFVKEHIKNRAMRIYPNNPVFVDRMRNLLHKDLLENGKPENERGCSCYNLNAFCLYHVMLRTLRYTNEIVVDISNNCLQSLFWLGAAHGSDIYAITVSHEKTDMEKTRDLNSNKKENRNVFDVAGLWMAILRKDDMEGFYHQLALAQSGIERHSKLMLSNSDFYKVAMKEYLFSFDVVAQRYDDNNGNKPEQLYDQKRQEERNTLESYYRACFWTPMLSYNKLCIYLSQTNEKGEGDTGPRLYMSKWDYDAVAVFTNYLSKRKVIGEYLLVSLSAGKSIQKSVPEPEKINFICVGSEVNPMDKSLPDYVKEQIDQSSFVAEGISGINIVHRRCQIYVENSAVQECIKEKRSFKGFECINDPKKIIVTQQPQTNTCIGCPRLNQNNGTVNNEPKIFSSRSEAEGVQCQLEREGMHYETAQILLWREDSENSHDQSYFRVGIMGCSGPATYKLSTLFVAREQQDSPEDENLLYDLQSIVRQKFMEVFLLKLREELGGIEMMFCDDNGTMMGAGDENQIKRYFILVEHAVCAYLNTVLYRYFFPFLTEKDIDRICNGMYTFVNSMKAARVSPFALNYHSNKDRKFTSFVSNETITAIVIKIPEVLGSTMRSFKGLEAFYKVVVRHNLGEHDGEEDTRNSMRIEPVKDEKFTSVNYFFIDKKKI